MFTMNRCTSSSLLFTSSILLFLILTNRVGATYNPSAVFGSQHLSTLLPRQDVCSDDPSSISCGVGSFCCPSDTRCIPVESNTSVVCCKTGEFCDEIFPISCTSTTLTTQSVTCGTQCCPTGYECGVNGDRCIMKPENLPADHIANREGKKNATDEALMEQCQKFLNLPATGDGEFNDQLGTIAGGCPKFTFEGILVGFFSGVVVGVTAMFGYIKFVEMKTRRRTIHFNGRLSASPDDLRSYIDQKPPPVPRIQEDMLSRYSATPAERAVSSAPVFQRDWKARGPTDYSPNLGPTIAPRERSRSRDGRGSATSRSTTSTNPPSQPLSAAAPLKPRPAYTPVYRASSESTASVTESDFSAAVSQTLRNAGHRAHNRIDEVSDDEDRFSEVVIMDGTRGRGRNRISAETGYTASFYQGGEGLSQPPFALEEEVPPLRYGNQQLPGGGGKMGMGLGWDNNRF